MEKKVQSSKLPFYFIEDNEQNRNKQKRKKELLTLLKDRITSIPKEISDDLSKSEIINNQPQELSAYTVTSQGTSKFFMPIIIHTGNYVVVL